MITPPNPAGHHQPPKGINTDYFFCCNFWYFYNIFIINLGLLMKKRWKMFIPFTLVSVFLLTGCATILRGYEQKVDVLNRTPDTKIYTTDNIEVPIQAKLNYRLNKEEKRYVVADTTYYIVLHQAHRQILTVSANGRQKNVEMYPYLSGGYLIADIIFGVIPAFVDSETGCWYHFDGPIDLAL